MDNLLLHLKQKVVRLGQHGSWVAGVNNPWAEFVLVLGNTKGFEEDEHENKGERGLGVFFYRR